MPRARREFDQDVGADYGPGARSVLDAVPALFREAEAVGAVALARFLGQASRTPKNREAYAMIRTRGRTMRLRRSIKDAH